MRGPDCRPAPLLPVALLGVGLLGCALDFTEPLQNEAALLWLTVSVEEGVHPFLDVQGQFDPGRDAQGVFRTVVDPTIEVAGMSISPDGGRFDGLIHYQATVPLTPESLRLPMEVRGAQVAGVSLSQPMFRFGVCLREGEDVVSLDSDGYLRLEIRCVRPPEMGGTVPLRWTLSLRSPDGSFGLRLDRSAELVPSIIELPGASLLGAGADELEASLSILDEAEWENETGRYRLSLRVSSVLHWRVHLDG